MNALVQDQCQFRQEPVLHQQPVITTQLDAHISG
jgi:hypothetical protein